MARTRLVPKRRPNVNLNIPGRDVDFQAKRVAATKEAKRRIRVSDVKIKFLLPRVKDVEHVAKKRNVKTNKQTVVVII